MRVWGRGVGEGVRLWGRGAGEGVRVWGRGACVHVCVWGSFHQIVETVLGFFLTDSAEYWERGLSRADLRCWMFWVRSASVGKWVAGKFLWGCQANGRRNIPEKILKVGAVQST